MSGWVFLLTALVTGLLLARARYARARRRRQAYERGEPVQLPVRLAVDAPADTGAYAPGWLATDGPAPVWRPRRAGMTPIPLGGARVLRTDAPGGPLRTEFVVTAQLADGTLLRLATGFPYLELLQRILGPPAGVDLTKHPGDAYAPSPYAPPPGQPPYAPPPGHPPYAPPPGQPPYAPSPGQPPYGPPRPRGVVPWWSAALLGLAAGWALVWAWIWLGGTTLDATVTANPDGPGCDVSWTGPVDGRDHEARVDCAQEARPGDTVRILALPGGLSGTATDLRTAVLFPVLIGSSAVLAAALGIALRLRARRVPGTRRRAGRAAAYVPMLASDEVTYTRICEVMAARAVAEGWAGPDPAADDAGPQPGEQPHGPPDDAPARWWHVRGLRRLAWRSALRLLLPLVLAGVAVAAGLGSWITTARLAGGDTTVTQGVVLRTADDALLPFLPERALVHYRADGRVYDVWLPVRADLTRGQEVSVLYAAAAPAQARLDQEGDGLPRQAAVTGTVAALAAALMVRRISRTLRDLHSLVRARREPGRPWRFVRFVDHTGRPGVMLFSRFTDAAPVAVLPLLPDDDPAAPPLPVSGEAPVHGEVTPGALLVPVLGGRTCWPLGRAAELPPEAVRNLVNGTLPESPLSRLTPDGRNRR